MDLFFIYLLCFGVGLLFAVISAFTADVFGGGHDADTGGDIHTGDFPAHDMPTFSALSPTVIASFITSFGGFGMIFSKFEATASPWISAPLSAVGGFVVAGCVLWLFRFIFNKTQSSSESKVSNLPGTMATVITPITDRGVGEIAYVHGGTRYTAPARTEDGITIESGRTVKITRVVGSQFYVVGI